MYYLKMFLVTLVTFFVIDIVWLGLIARIYTVRNLASS